jgi:hypothetical protein
VSIWKGIVGEGFTCDEFDEYISRLEFDLWRPEFVVLHNTQIPRLDAWHSVSGEERMRGFEKYYRDEMDWSAGPHLFVADDLIWVLTALTTSGIHSPSWNKISWGVEMVGDYDEEPLDPGVYRNTIRALTAMHARLGLDPKSLRFHKEDTRTTHTFCPGKNVVKSQVLSDLERGLAKT